MSHRYHVERRAVGSLDHWHSFVAEPPLNKHGIPEVTLRGWTISADFPRLDLAVEACEDLRGMQRRGDCALSKSGQDGLPWLRVVNEDGEVCWTEPAPDPTRVPTNWRPSAA